MENLRQEILNAVVVENKVCNIFSPLVVKKIAVDLDKDYPQAPELLAFFSSANVKLLWKKWLTKEDLDAYPFLKHENFVKARYFLFDRTLQGYYDFFKATEVCPAKKYVVRLKELRHAEKERLSGHQVNFREFDSKLAEAEDELLTALEAGKLQRWQLYSVFVIFALFSDYIGEVNRLRAVFEKNKEAIIAAAAFQ